MVMSLGSSAEPIGGGSTYLRVVRSSRMVVSHGVGYRVWVDKRTLLRVDFHLYVEVDAQDDEIRHHIENPDAQKDLRVFKRDFLRYLHHAENDDQVCAVGSESQPSVRSHSSDSSREHTQGRQGDKNLHLGISQIEA